MILPDNFYNLNDIRQSLIFVEYIDILAWDGKFDEIYQVLTESLQYSHSVIMSLFRSCSSYRDKIKDYDYALMLARQVIDNDDIFIGLI